MKPRIGARVWITFNFGEPDLPGVVLHYIGAHELAVQDLVRGDLHIVHWHKLQPRSGTMINFVLGVR